MTEELNNAFRRFYATGRIDEYLKYAKMREKQHGGHNDAGPGDPNDGLPGQR